MAVTYPDHVVQKPLELVCGRGLETSGAVAREALECCKQSLMDGSGGSSEDHSADRNVDSKDCAMRFRMGMRTLLEIGLEDILFHSGKKLVYILSLP
jgi:hypothetical protein